MIIVETFEGARPRAASPRRAGSGSTPHDRRRAVPPPTLRSHSLAAARRTTTAMASQRPTDPRSRAVFTLVPHLRAIQNARASSCRSTPSAASSFIRSRTRIRPRPSNPHRSRSHPRPFLPAVSSLRGFRTPAPGGSPNRRAKGRRPKPFSIPVGWRRRIADVADLGLGRLNWADRGPTRIASGRTGVGVRAAIRSRGLAWLRCSRRLDGGGGSSNTLPVGVTIW